MTRYYEREIYIIGINMTLILERDLCFSIFLNKLLEQCILNIVKKCI